MTPTTRRTRILDRTLCATAGRDGRDTADQVASIAVLLAELGADAIECPAPDSRSGEPGCLGPVLGALSNVPVLAWCGTNPEAVGAASAQGVSWVGVAFGGDRDGHLESALRQASKAGLRVRLDVQAEEPHAAVDKLLSRTGIDRICLVGDVATGEPDGMRAAVMDWRVRCPGTEIEVRASDAYSLATANALAAAQAGATGSRRRCPDRAPPTCHRCLPTCTAGANAARRTSSWSRSCAGGSAHTAVPCRARPRTG